MEGKKRSADDIIDILLDAANKMDKINHRLIIAQPVTVLIICISAIIMLNMVLFYMYDK